VETVARDDLPGWTAENGLLSPSATVGGYAARGQSVKGACRAEGCSRRVELEPEHLCKLGYALLTMDKVQRLWRCHQLEGCGLSFHKEPALRPLRLGLLVGRPHIRVRLRCRGNDCKFHRVWRVEEMISGLAKRRQGDDSTDIDSLGAKMTAPCPICKKTNWEADILCANTESAGWRAQGERMFETTERRRNER
jgi:hypothetical protein